MPQQNGYHFRFPVAVGPSQRPGGRRIIGSEQYVYIGIDSTVAISFIRNIEIPDTFGNRMIGVGNFHS